MLDQWADAREQLRGASLLSDVEAELVGDHPAEAELLSLLRHSLDSRAHMRDALLVARARDDEQAIAEARDMYAMAQREARASVRAVVDLWEDEGGSR